MEKRRPRIQALLVLLVILGVCLFPLQSASADAGPKPSLKFRFVYMYEPAPTVVSGDLMICVDPECSLATAVKEIGPKGLSCEEGECHSQAYHFDGYSEWHYIRITFSDGRILESNPFTRENFSAIYRVTVYPDHLEVEETGNDYHLDILIFSLFLLFMLMLVIAGLGVALLINGKSWKGELTFERDRIEYYIAWVYVGGLIISNGLNNHRILFIVIFELFFTWIILSIQHKPKAVFLTLLLIANACTHFLLIILSESFWEWGESTTNILFGFSIVIMEAFILYFPQRKIVSFTEMLSMSLILNISSYILVLLLPV